MCTAWIKIVRMRQFLKATRLYDHFLSHFKRHQEKKKEIEPLPNLNRDDTLISQFSLYFSLAISVSFIVFNFVCSSSPFFLFYPNVSTSVYLYLSI